MQITLPAQQLSSKTSNQWHNNGSTELYMYCLFIPVDSIADATSFNMQCSVIQTYSHQIRMWLRLWLNFSSWIWLDVAQAGFAIVRPRSSTEKTTKWINGSKKQYTLERNMTSQWTETRSPVNFLTSMTGCLPQHLEANGSYHHYSWIHSMYGANDASCTSDGTTSYLTMKSCIVPACSTSRTSFASEDWVSLGTSPDFDAIYQQTRSYKSAPSRGMVSGLHRSGDVPVADHQPPGPTRSAATRV